LATLTVVSKNPGREVQIQIDDAAILKLFEDAAECRESVRVNGQRLEDGLRAINKRIDALWRIVLAGFASSVGIIAIGLAVIDMVTR
jgi:hypothetical protein